MKGLAIVRPGDVDEHAGHPRGHRTTGTFRSSRRTPEPWPLWLVVAHAGAGATLTLPSEHGDEAVYVQRGEVEIDGRTCPAGGAVVVEADAAGELRTLTDSTLVHVGPADPTPPLDDRHPTLPTAAPTVHVVGPQGTWARVAADRDTHYYADSTCPTCRITLLYTSRFGPWVSRPHSHSADEVIHLLSGSIDLGSHHLDAGATLAIEADRRYAFRGGPQGFAFLNYRRTASEQTIAGEPEPIVEGGEVNGLVPVMDLR